MAIHRDNVCQGNQHNVLQSAEYFLGKYLGLGDISPPPPPYLISAVLNIPFILVDRLGVGVNSNFIFEISFVIDVKVVRNNF